MLTAAKEEMLLLGTRILGNGEILSKTRVWGFEQKCCTSSRATAELSQNTRWGSEKSSWENVSGSALDNNGNTLTKSTSSETTQYAWDFENRLASVTLPSSGGVVSFKYDPFGRRVQKSGSSLTTNYLYDGNSPIEELDDARNILARYAQTLATDEPLSIVSNGLTNFYSADGIGSITSLTNAAAALVQTYTFNAFGEVTTSSGSVTSNFGYIGREYDPETGLLYLRARYYDPSNGRFISEDPLRFVTEAPYFYASNSPLNFTDPSGLAPGDWWDPRTPANVWNQLNPFNANGSLSNTATAIWDSLSGMATGNWEQVAQSYDKGPYGQIGCKRCRWRTIETTTLAGSGVAAGAAGGLILLDAAGISNLGETQIGWKGGEITFTRPGCKTPDFRINPFGDDDWPPHYHRRPGIGKHRPVGGLVE